MTKEQFHQLLNCAKQISPAKDNVAQSTNKLSHLVWSAIRFAADNKDNPDFIKKYGLISQRELEEFVNDNGMLL